MKRFHPIYLLFILAITTLGCEDVIDITTDEAPNLLVVDAWLNNQPSQTQVIRLTQSQPYFDNEFATGVTGADVLIIRDDSTIINFVEAKNGDYIWTPAPNESIGSPGSTFLLNITWNNAIYTSATQMGPVTIVDSIGQEFRTDEIGGPDGIYATLFARDLPGLGNAYWIKTFKNNQFLNKPQELNIAFDAAFDPGAQLDGVNFILPIREAINRIPDSEGDDDNEVAPWSAGDSIRVEIHSISPTAFSFLDIARDQMTNGDNTIFALPLANAKGNVLNMSGGEDALGIFNVAAVSMMSKEIQEE